jgi:hypothetical protein
MDIDQAGFGPSVQAICVPAAIPASTLFSAFPRCLSDKLLKLPIEAHGDSNVGAVSKSRRRQPVILAGSPSSLVWTDRLPAHKRRNG